MKKSVWFFAAALMLGAAACTNSDEPTVDNGQETNESAVVALAPTQAAKVSITSNSQTIGNGSVLSIESAAGLANETTKKLGKTFIELLPEEKDNIKTTPSKAGVSDWTTNYLYVSNGEPFTLYPVYSQAAFDNVVGIYYYDAEGNMHKQQIFDMREAGHPYGAYQNQKGIKITVAKGYKFGFYLSTKQTFSVGKGYQKKSVTVTPTFYSYIAENKNVCSKEVHAGYGLTDECHGEGVHSVSFNYNDQTFFGFEDWEYVNDNYDLNDLVFMCSPSLTPKENPDEGDKTPDPEPTPEPTPDPTPDPSPIVSTEGSVEINFSMNERSYTSNEAKLSIHVRDTTDVEVFIPTPKEYYCPVDDMLIVQKHDVAMVYKTEQNVQMEIAGSVVTLNIAYGENGITVKSEGINADILKYLRNTYNDGLTFEVNLYFATERLNENGEKVDITQSEIQAYLNKSTVAFTQTPKYYLNSFGTINGVINALDCTVAPYSPALFQEMRQEDAVYGTSKLNVYERK